MSFWQKYKIEIILFIMLWLSYSYFFAPSDDNIVVRMALIYSVVDYHTLKLDNFKDILDKFLDKAFYQGHYYCDKAPGASFLGIPVYIFLRLINPHQDIYTVSRWIITSLVISLSGVLLAVGLFRFLFFLSGKKIFSFYATIIFGLGTPVFAYSVMFYGHILAASLLFLSFYLLFKTKENQDRISFKIFWSGLLAGWGVISDYPAGIICLALLGYLWFITKEKKRIWLFIIGILPAVFILGWYNWMCFGKIITVNYLYPVGNYFIQGGRQGFMGMTIPKLSALYGITFSPYRGIFFYAPVFLLSFLGFYLWFKNGVLRKEFYLFLFIVLSYFYFNGSFYLWWGGLSLGPRYLVPMLPFLFIPVIFCYEKFKNIFLILGAISIFLNSAAVIVRPQQLQFDYNPLFNYVLPFFITGKYTTINLGTLLLKQTGMITLLPWLLIVVLSIGLILKAKSSRYFTNKNSR